MQDQEQKASPEKIAEDPPIENSVNDAKDVQSDQKTKEQIDDQNQVNKDSSTKVKEKEASNQRKMIRELGYVGGRDNAAQILAQSSENPQIPIDARTSRADRVGGLDYYRNRKDQFDNSYQRKKHGHLQNIITGNKDGINSKAQSKAKLFVESQLKKRLMSDNQ